MCVCVCVYTHTERKREREREREGGGGGGEGGDNWLDEIRSKQIYSPIEDSNPGFSYC